ncbi:MAG: chromosome partitioning protein ParB, partial [Brevundimonas diminuta]
MGENAQEPVAVDAAGPAPAGVQRAPIEALKPNPDQPRKVFAKTDLDELTSSIRNKGVL